LSSLVGKIPYRSFSSHTKKGKSIVFSSIDNPYVRSITNSVFHSAMISLVFYSNNKNTLEDLITYRLVHKSIHFVPKK